MNISKINSINSYSYSFKNKNTKNASKQNVSFGNYSAHNYGDAYNSLRGDYERDRLLYGSGYGKTEFVGYDTYVRARMNGFKYAPQQTDATPDSDDVLADEYIAKHKFYPALQVKLNQAMKFNNMGLRRDTFLIEEGIRKLYPKLNYNEKIAAKRKISEYKPDMAKYIDDDVAKQFINEEKYYDALQIKLDKAREQRDKGRERDTFLLEDSVRRLYMQLNYNEKQMAKQKIATYNHDMAKYIDEDIKNL